MQSKSLLIAIAAFAVTATGAQAYGGAILHRANLTDTQREALEEARELRQSGKVEEARDLLVKAGIDETVVQQLRQAVSQNREDIKEAIETGNYELFRDVVGDTPLANQITSASDFERLQEAHELQQAGDFTEARHIFADLGIERPQWRLSQTNHRGLHQLTDRQREAWRVAKQANDRETARAILDEGGVGRW
jgi:hypothetical protein